MPTFSVILTTYGRQALLDQAIASVLGQSDQDFELFVIDDASPSPAVVPDDPRISLIRHQENQGVAAARNTGLAECGGAYIAFLDDDDLYDPRRLEMVRPALMQPRIVLCWSRFIGEPVAGRRLEGSIPGRLLAGTTPHVGAITVHRDVAKPFDTSYRGAEDVEWWVRMSDVPVTTVPAVGYWMRQHGGARFSNGTDARIAGSHRLLRQHAEFFSRHPRAAAFRWRRIGLMRGDQGERLASARALGRSLRLYPSPRTLWHLLRITLQRR